jgi:hypothetical protein
MAELRAMGRPAHRDDAPDLESDAAAIPADRKGRASMTVKMDNVGVVVESLDTAISFFAELGLELEGRAAIEGEWAGRVTGLRDQRVEG